MGVKHDLGSTEREKREGREFIYSGQGREKRQSSKRKEKGALIAKFVWEIGGERGGEGNKKHNPFFCFVSEAAPSSTHDFCLCI